MGEGAACTGEVGGKERARKRKQRGSPKVAVAQQRWQRLALSGA